MSYTIEDKCSGVPPDMDRVGSSAEVTTPSNSEKE
jgi:hypothetical protein